MIDDFRGLDDADDPRLVAHVGQIGRKAPRAGRTAE